MLVLMGYLRSFTNRVKRSSKRVKLWRWKEWFFRPSTTGSWGSLPHSSFCTYSWGIWTVQWRETAYWRTISSFSSKSRHNTARLARLSLRSQKQKKYVQNSAPKSSFRKSKIVKKKSLLMPREEKIWAYNRSKIQAPLVTQALMPFPQTQYLSNTMRLVLIARAASWSRDWSPWQRYLMFRCTRCPL